MRRLAISYENLLQNTDHNNNKIYLEMQFCSWYLLFMKIVIQVGSKVSFDEFPTLLDYGTEGTVTCINHQENCVFVRVPEWNDDVVFHLDGSSWSLCSEFKRETAFIDWTPTN